MGTSSPMGQFVFEEFTLAELHQMVGIGFFCQMEQKTMLTFVLKDPISPVVMVLYLSEVIVARRASCVATPRIGGIVADAP